MTDSSDKAPEAREPLAAPASYQSPSGNEFFPTWERNLKFAGVAATVVVVVVGFRYWKAQQPLPAVPVMRFSEATQWTSGDGLTLSPAIAHSGKLAAYASDREGPGSLAIWTQPFNSGKPKRVTRGEFNESDPDFSPDDRQIVFHSDRDGGGIYVVPADGGSPPRLVAKEGGRPKFSPDGKWIAFSKLTGSEDVSSAFGAGQVFVVPAEGGEPRRIQPDFPFARHPIWTPDGKHLLFVGTRSDGAKDWWVSGIDGGEPIRTHAVDWLSGLVKSVGMPDQWRGERIFFSAAEESQPHIWQLPVSFSSWQVSGPPRRLTNGSGFEQQSAVSPDGSVMFSSMKKAVEIYSLAVDADQAKVLGKLEALTNFRGAAQLPSMAAGGSKLAYVSDRSGMRDIWISDASGKGEEAVTTFRPIGYRPVISADGKLLIYPSSVKGKCAVLMQPAEAGGAAAALKGCFAIWDWSQDGADLLTFRSGGDMNTVDLIHLKTGERKPVLTHAKRSFYGARFSPDARSIAFASGMTSGQARLYIAPLRSPAVHEPEWIRIEDNAGEPAWSPDGAVLYFRSKRDGYHCIWAQRLGPGKKPQGEAIPIQHFHSAAFGLYLLKGAEFNLTVARDRLILNVGKDSSNVWMTRPEQ